MRDFKVLRLHICTTWSALFCAALLFGKFTSYFHSMFLVGATISLQSLYGFGPMVVMSVAYVTDTLPFFQ